MGLTALVGDAPWTDPDFLALEESDAPHITARQRADLDRHVRAHQQAEAAGITGLRDALKANA